MTEPATTLEAAEGPATPAVEALRKIRHPKKSAFLAAYAECGNISEAARLSGVSRDSHYDWLAADERYAKAFEEAQEIAVDHLEAEARRRAVHGVLEPVFYQGQQVGAIRRYSDTLLIFLLNGARPEKYRRLGEMRHTGPGGGPIKLEADYELSQRLMADPELLAAAEALAAAALEDRTAGALPAAPIPAESQEVAPDD